MDEFNFLGIWGNIDVNNAKDFINVIKPNPIVFEKGVYDDTYKKCTINSSVEIEILTSKLGATAAPQAYIVGAQVKPVKETWIFREGQTNYFQHTASVTYKEFLPIKLSGNAYSMLDKMAEDLFYPINLKNKAMELQVASVTLLMALVA
jgi:hypothetical protein